MAEEGFNHRGTLFAPSFGYLASSDLKHMPTNDQEAFVRDWFFSMYDPQTPDRREVDRLFGEDGLTFYADQEIKAQFSGVVSADVLEIVISDAARHAEQWIATDMHRKHYNYEERPFLQFEHEDQSGALDGRPFLRPDGKAVDILDPADLGLPFGEPVTDPFGERDPIADHDQIDARLERGVRTSFGTTYERAVRRSTLAHAADLQALLAKHGASKAKHGGIGHNQPPADITLDLEHSEQLKEAVETISEELNAELRNEQPDVRQVSRAARAIQSIGKWVAQKLDMTLDTFLKSLAKALGTSAAAAITAAGLFGYDPVVRKAMEL